MTWTTSFPPRTFGFGWGVRASESGGQTESELGGQFERNIHLGQPQPEPKAPRKERVRDLIEKIIGHAIDDCPECGGRGSLVRILLPANCRAPPQAPGA